MRAHWTQVVNEAVDLVRRDPPPSYQEMDCQEFVEECINKAGGLNIDYRGSNHMFREMCTRVMPLAEAQEKGLLHAGCLLFIVEPVNESTPAAYRTDGLGDATHVGFYADITVTTTGEYIEVAHSSASRGKVCASTLKNGWTHVGWCRHIDYDEAEDAGASDGEVHGVQYAVVDVVAGDLRMREEPRGKAAYMLRIPYGTQLEVTAHENGFARTAYNGYYGWVDEKYLRYLQPIPQPILPGDGTDGAGTSPVPNAFLQMVASQCLAFIREEA